MDIEYSDIQRMLKRYSFDEKIHICNRYSRKIIDSLGNISTTDMLKSVFPWELETFLLFSVMATPEYNDGDFAGKHENTFIKMVNAIRLHMNPAVEKLTETEKFLDYSFPSLGLQQFGSQQNFEYHKFRYSYFFNFRNEVIDMKKVFMDFFGTEYEDFLDLGVMLLLFYGSDETLNSTLIYYLMDLKYQKATEKLTITLEDYKAELEKITTSQADYTTCLRPSYKFPFLERGDNIYIPLPHVLRNAVTSSLLYRLTDGNNEIRRKFGKEVMESYLKMIIEESTCFDEVYPEKEFIMTHHQKAKTLDVMARSGNEFLFLDSKAAVPVIGLRIYDLETYDSEVKKQVERMVQLYKHLAKHLLLYPDYNPFENQPHIDKEHIWGISVVLEENYIRPSIVYERAADELQISLDSDEYKWMTTHLKITDIYQVERYSLNGLSLIDGLKRQIEYGNCNDLPLGDYGQKLECRVRSTKFKDIEKSSMDRIEKLIHDMEDHGILK